VTIPYGCSSDVEFLFDVNEKCVFSFKITCQHSSAGTDKTTDVYIKTGNCGSQIWGY